MSEEEILNKYEEIIFSFLVENCSEFNDEHIKHLVDLKVEQHNQLKSQLQQRENIIKEVRELLKRYQNNEYYYKYNGKYLKSEIKEDILKILDKENK